MSRSSGLDAASASAGMGSAAEAKVGTCFVAHVDRLVWPFNEQQLAKSRPIELLLEECDLTQRYTDYSRRVIVWKKPDTTLTSLDPLRDTGCPVLLSKPVKDKYRNDPRWKCDAVLGIPVGAIFNSVLRMKLPGFDPADGDQYLSGRTKNMVNEEFVAWASFELGQRPVDFQMAMQRRSSHRLVQDFAAYLGTVRGQIDIDVHTQVPGTQRALVRHCANRVLAMPNTNAFDAVLELIRDQVLRVLNSVADAGAASGSGASGRGDDNHKLADKLLSYLSQLDDDDGGAGGDGDEDDEEEEDASAIRARLLAEFAPPNDQTLAAKTIADSILKHPWSPYLCRKMIPLEVRERKQIYTVLCQTSLYEDARSDYEYPFYQAWSLLRKEEEEGHTFLTESQIRQLQGYHPNGHGRVIAFEEFVHSLVEFSCKLTELVKPPLFDKSAESKHANVKWSMPLFYDSEHKVLQRAVIRDAEEYVASEYKRRTRLPNGGDRRGSEADGVRPNKRQAREPRRDAAEPEGDGGAPEPALSSPVVVAAAMEVDEPVGPEEESLRPTDDTGDTSAEVADDTGDEDASDAESKTSRASSPTKSFLDDQQLGAVDRALDQRLCAITGFPGTGKTAVIHEIVARATPERNVVILSEYHKPLTNLVRRGVPAETCRTMTSFLWSNAGKNTQDDADGGAHMASGAPSKTKAKPKGKGQTANRKRKQPGSSSSTASANSNKEEDLNHIWSKDCLFIIEEASTLKLLNLSGFFHRVTEAEETYGCQVSIALVGDMEQLPPISPGRVFECFLSAFPSHSTVLDRIYRQKGPDGLALAVINNYKLALRGIATNWKTDRTFEPVSADGSSSVESNSSLVQVCAAQNYASTKKHLTQLLQHPSIVRDFNLDTDVAIALKRDTVRVLNQVLSEQHRTVLREALAHHWFVGARVVCRKTSKKFNVTNGLYGIVTGIMTENRRVMLQVQIDDGTSSGRSTATKSRASSSSSASSSSASSSRASSSRASSSSASSSRASSDDDAEPDGEWTRKRVTPARLWNYSYAVTCHTGQGSEFPKAIVIVDSIRCGRNWMYTAISRAQDKCLFVCTKRDREQCLGRPKLVVRQMLPKLLAL